MHSSSLQYSLDAESTFLEILDYQDCQNEKLTKSEGVRVSIPKCIPFFLSKGMAACVV